MHVPDDTEIMLSAVRKWMKGHPDREILMIFATEQMQSGVMCSPEIVGMAQGLKLPQLRHARMTIQHLLEMAVTPTPQEIN